MILLIILSGAAFSFLGTLVGLGGGVFMVPLLVLVADFTLPMAVGSVALALFPSALISTIINYRRKTIDYKAAFVLEIPTIVGAWVGAMLTAILPVKPLEFIFAFFVLFMAWNIHPKKSETLHSHWVERFNNVPGTSFLGLLSGVLAGLFGVGGGILKTPVLLKIFKLPAKRAAATSLAMIMITSLVSATKHYQLGHIDKSSGFVVAGFMLGSILGNIFNRKIPDQNIQSILSFAMVLAAIAVIIHGITL